MSKSHDQECFWPGSLLRTIREEQGLTRELLAERSNTGLRHLAAIELGQKNPSVDTLRRLIRGLGVSADQVFYPEFSSGDPDLDELTRLAATCNSKQRKLLIGLLHLLLEQEHEEK